MGYQGKDNEKKIPYDRWVYGKSLMDRLREEGGLSMSELSRTACGNGDTPGWAQNAYQHRTIMREHQIRNMENLLQPKRHRGSKVGDVKLNRDQARAYQQLVRRLRDFYHWDNQKIGSALNISPETVSRTANGHGGGTLSVLRTAQGLVDQLDRANRNGHVSEEEAPVIQAVQQEAVYVPPPPVVLPPPKVEAREQGEAVATVTPLDAAVLAGAAFIRELVSLEASLPAFAKKGARELGDRARAIVAELTDGGGK